MRACDVGEAVVIRLRLLGQLSLTDAEGQELHGLLAQPRRLALLAYLAAARPHGFQRRDAVLALFWPELDQEHARAALRQALHTLRGTLGADIVVVRGDDDVGINTAQLWCDVPTFDDAIRTGRYEDAAALYRGDLLAGFFVSAALDFDQWLEGERRRLREAAVRGAQAMADRAELDGDQQAVVEWARRAVRLAPLGEEGVRRLVLALDAAGDRAGAVSVYEEFAAQLQRELEVEPAPETTALIAAVRARSAARAVATLAPTAPPDTRRSESPGASVPRAAPEDRRHSHTPAALLGVAAALGVASAAVAWYARGHSATALQANRVVVSGFVNRTGDSTLDPLGELAAQWIVRGLAETGAVEIAEPAGMLAEQDDRRLHNPTSSGGDAAAVLDLARATGSGLVVWGTLFRRADHVEFDANLTDARTGRRVATLEPVVGDVRDPRPAIATMRERLMSALAQSVDRRFADSSLIAGQPPRYEAFLAFRSGVNLFFDRGDYGGEVLPELRRASALDTAYALPLIWASSVHRIRDDCDSVEALAGRLSRMRLTPVERLQVEREPALCRGDLARAFEVSRELAEALPGSEVAAEQLARNALSVDRPATALRVLERLHPDSGALRGNTLYYLFLTAAYHDIGRHDEERVAAARGRSRYRGLGILRHELVALAALGRVRDIDARLPELDGFAPGPYRHPATVMRETALELAVHGHPDAGARLLQHELTWLRNRAAAEQASGPARFERALALYAAGQHDLAATIADSLAREEPGRPGYVGLHGAIAAQHGDRAAAARADSLLARFVQPFAHGVPTYWRACIAARLGDRDRAVALLAEANRQGMPFKPATTSWTVYVLGAHVEPSFASLRGHPSFEALLRPKG